MRLARQIYDAPVTLTLQAIYNFMTPFSPPRAALQFFRRGGVTQSGAFGAFSVYHTT